MEENWVVVYENESGIEVFAAYSYDHACEIRIGIVKEGWKTFFQEQDIHRNIEDIAENWHEFTGGEESISVQELNSFEFVFVSNKVYRAGHVHDEGRCTTWNSSIEGAAAEACVRWGKDCQAILEVLEVSETGENNRPPPTEDEIVWFEAALKEIREGAKA